MMRAAWSLFLVVALLAPAAAARDPDGSYRQDASAVAKTLDASIHAARTAVTRGTLGGLSDRQVAHVLRLQQVALGDAAAQLAGITPPRAYERAHGELARAMDGYGHGLALLEQCYRKNDDALCAQAYADLSASEYLRQLALADYGFGSSFA